MNLLFQKYLDDLHNKNMDSDIYQIFLNQMDISYIENTDFKRIVIDYIAGMTDDYFLQAIHIVNAVNKN